MWRYFVVVQFNNRFSINGLLGPVTDVTKQNPSIISKVFPNFYFYNDIFKNISQFENVNNKYSCSFYYIYQKIWSGPTNYSPKCTKLTRIYVDTGYPEWDFSWFSSVLPRKFLNSVPVSPRPFPFRYFPIYHSSIILSLDAMLSRFWRHEKQKMLKQYSQ